MSSDKALEILVDLADALEAVALKVKHEVAQLQGLEKLKSEENLDFSKLSWEEKKSEKGPFQQTSEKTNGNSVLWQQLKAKMKEHGGFWQNTGFKYWNDMRQETVVDRRKTA